MKEYFLKTERLGFSVWDDKDLSDALDLWGNQEVTKFIATNGKMSEEQIKERLKIENKIFKGYINEIQFFI